MKLQIDTTNKTIKIEQDANLLDFYKAIKKLLPDDWKEYKVLTTEIYTWTYPIVYKYEDIKPIEWKCTDSVLPATIESSYNIEVQ